jgi:hypothetical protein
LIPARKFNRLNRAFIFSFAGMKNSTYIMLIPLILIQVWNDASATTIHVPGDLPSIGAAIELAGNGDTILLAPGTYHENITLSKALVIASHYLSTGTESLIDQTIIDGSAQTVIDISGPENMASSIIGLTIRNGEDGIMASGPLNLLHNVIEACGDGIDYETGGGGSCIGNIFKENLDDGIDLDGSLSDLIIEDNVIGDNDDDGIEIRLHAYSGMLSVCRISNNRIFNNGEDGIQFIDYPDTSSRKYILERNLIYNNKMAGIGCMDNGNTREDYRGAAIPEPICLFNNTISGHVYGITGGAGLISVNNLIIQSSEAGSLNVAGNSVHAYSLFWDNTKDLINSNFDDASCIFEDPLITLSFYPMPESPCIDRGTPIYIHETDTLLHLSQDQYDGSGPDIGAIEHRVQSSDDESGLDTGISIYPNPCRDYLEISLPGRDLDGSVMILDQTGRVIINPEIRDDKIRLQLEKYSPGVYFVLLPGAEKYTSHKIMKL